MDEQERHYRQMIEHLIWPPTWDGKHVVAFITIDGDIYAHENIASYKVTVEVDAYKRLVSIKDLVKITGPPSQPMARKSHKFYYFDISQFRFTYLYTNMHWYEYYNPIYAIQRYINVKRYTGGP